MSYLVKSLAWDSKHFNRNAGRLDLQNELDEGTFLKAIQETKEFEFLTIANKNNEAINNIWIAKNTNAYLVDVNIQFEKKLTKLQESVSKSINIINNYSDKNNTLQKLVKGIYSESRFYTDPMISSEDASNVYVEWLKNSFSKNEYYFVVNSNENKIANGFLNFNISGNVAIIGLVAVSQDSRGKGIGSQLLHEMEQFLIKNNISRVQVGTQVNNLKAINLYSNNNYKYINNTSVYHLWR